MSDAPQITELYRHFDSAGVLLYVGVSLSVLHRLRKHRQQSEWFGAIATITIERFPSRAEALAAERLAVKNERPRWNQQLTGSRMKEPPPRESLADRLRRKRAESAAARDAL